MIGQLSVWVYGLTAPGCSRYGTINDGAASYHGDIIGWARAGGLYAGLTLNDSTMEQKPSLNAEYYDRPVPFDDIFMGRSCNRDADALRSALK